MPDQSGRVFLITGANSGIGLEAAKGLTRKGARVVMASRNLAKAEAVRPEVGDGAEVRELDLGSLASVRAFASAWDGPIDVLVNNAGTDRFAFFLHTTPELWDIVLGVNLRGTLAVTHAALPSMHERGGGAIVNVASEAGRVGSQGSVAYSAAKAGVIGFTKALARESARYGVRCNAVAPGPIETPLLNAAPQQLGELGVRLKQGMINATAMGRSGEPDEVAAVIAFLASDDAAYVTGQTVGVSGGLSMW
jgi:2-hydroxycyclohexanecarboxyl-CoA dehydrogenase